MKQLGLKKLLKGSNHKKDDSELSTSDANTDDPSHTEEPVVYHQDADENGGMACTNEELSKVQREAIMSWIKSMGKRLLSGSINLINTPFPVTMFEPRSYLEKLADVWVYPQYLTAAARATDPVERMKLVTTWFIAGLHHAFESWRKPFNPILGETWQATLSDGTSMFMEQISHHPPVSAFHMEGPGGSYTFRGLSQPTVSIMVKYYGFKTVAKGYRYVQFPDGTCIELHYPQYLIKNVVYSTRAKAEVDGQAILIDARNKLKTVLTFGQLKGAKNKVLRRADGVYGFVYDCRNNQASLLDKASTADMALDETIAAQQRTGGAEDGDEDEFESASETEWDASKEEAETSEALERAAAEARADAGEGPDLGGLGPAPDDGMAEDGVNGNYQLASPSSSAPDRHSSSGVGGAVPAKGDKKGENSSFFGMSLGNMSLGKMLKLAPVPSSSTMTPTPLPSDTEGPVLASIEGSWLSHLNIDGRRYWSVQSAKPDRWTPVQDALPSDSRYRNDLVMLARGDMKAAQTAKEQLENLQRADKRLREAALGIKH